ncbi:5362_t:CDS:2, partial [Gigaspora rosea]
KNTYICPTIQEAIQKNVHPIPEETQPKIWQFPAVPEATSNIPATAYSPLTDAMLQNAYQLQTVQMAMQNICPPLTFSGAPSILLIDVIRLTALYGDLPIGDDLMSFIVYQKGFVEDNGTPQTTNLSH